MDLFDACCACNLPLLWYRYFTLKAASDPRTRRGRRNWRYSHEDILVTSGFRKHMDLSRVCDCNNSSTPAAGREISNSFKTRCHSHCHSSDCDTPLGFRAHLRILVDARFFQTKPAYLEPSRLQQMPNPRLQALLKP